MVIRWPGRASLRRVRPEDEGAGQRVPGNRTAGAQKESVCHARARRHTEGRAEGGGQARSHGAWGRGRKCGFHGRILSRASSLSRLSWAAWLTADCCLEGRAGRVARRSLQCLGERRGCGKRLDSAGLPMTWM